MAKTKTPAQGKAQGAEGSAPAETVVAATAEVQPPAIEVPAIETLGPVLVSPDTMKDLDAMLDAEQKGAPTPAVGDARPPLPPTPDAVLEDEIVPDEMPLEQKHELHTRLTEFLSHFDRARDAELSKIPDDRLSALVDLRDQVHIAIAQDRLEEGVRLAEQLGHLISAALIPDFDAELADDAENGAPPPGSGRFRVTRDGTLMQRGFPTTIRKGSVITSSTYNMDDVHAAVRKGRLHIEEI